MIFSDLTAVRGIKGCGIMTEVAHRFALRCADDCPYCLSLLVEGVGRERDRLWCAALKDEDAAVIERVTARVNAARALAGGKEEG